MLLVSNKTITLFLPFTKNLIILHSNPFKVYITSPSFLKFTYY